MGDEQPSAVRLPPRWFIRTFWAVHRFVVRVSGARVGLWRPRPGKWGTLRVTTIGRRTGRQHRVVIAYLEDGDNLIAMAMNGWGAAEPAWWLNLQEHPRVRIDLPAGRREVVARAAHGQERERLWARWAELDAQLDEYAALRPGTTSVVVFEPASPA